MLVLEANDHRGRPVYLTVVSGAKETKFVITLRDAAKGRWAGEDLGDIILTQRQCDQLAKLLK